MIIGNTFIYFMLAPSFQTASIKLNETLGDDIIGDKPREVFDKIIGRGIDLTDLTLLYFLGNIVAIVWGLMNAQKEEVVSGRYPGF